MPEHSAILAGGAGAVRTGIGQWRWRMSNLSSLEEQFRDALLEDYRAVRPLYGPAPWYLDMIISRPVEAARRLVMQDAISSGLARLHQLGLLNYSAEARVAEDQWQLFSEKERVQARRKLDELGWPTDGL